MKASVSKMTGGHVFERDFGGLEGHVEAVGRGRGGQHDNGRLAVAAVEGLQQVGLFRLGGQAGRGSAALHVDDDERQFGHDGETYGFALQGETGSRGRGGGQVAGEAGADGGAYAGDFVFGLYHFHAEVLAFGQFVQNVAGRGDGVAAQEEGASRFFGGGDEPQCRGAVAVDVGIDTFSGIAGFDVIGGDRGVNVSAVVVSVGHDLDVGFENRRLFGKFVLQQVFGLFERAFKEPADEAEGEHVLATQYGFVVEP